jgi:hypothetical protein
MVSGEYSKSDPSRGSATPFEPVRAKRTDSIKSGAQGTETTADPAPLISAEPAPSASVTAGNGDAGVDEELDDDDELDEVFFEEGADAGADATPDGWVKPEWARPDDEPPVRRDPLLESSEGENTPKKNPY